MNHHPGPIEREMMERAKAVRARLYTPQKPKELPKPPQCLSMDGAASAHFADWSRMVPTEAALTFDEKSITPPTWREIVNEVCRKHGVTFNEVMSIRRAHPIVRARQEAYYRLATETTMSLAAIGRKVGRDHTTIMYGKNAHIRRMEAANG